jgi:ABC-type Na+ efflux pump permease subunit
MRTVLVIAWSEIGRLRRRFRGGASPLAVLILLAVIGISVYSMQQTELAGNGLYRVGVWGNVPVIKDNRFVVSTVSPTEGQKYLSEGRLDVFIEGDQVYLSGSEKSLNAVGALRRYLERKELERLAQENDPQRAFPLRVAVRYAVGGQPMPTLAAGQTPVPTLPPPEPEILIPSLMTPKLPFAEVIISMLYILPVTFISIFFTSSFMDEKINRRLIILFSSPITPLQIILGKMLPYLIFSLLSSLVLAIFTKASPLLALAIFAPVMLFIFAIYLMVPMFYRTFKDTTFISMLVTTLTTIYLVFPAMFNGVSEVAFLSPLTLAIKMYQGEAFSVRQYLFPSLPMALIFGVAVFAGTRMLNEEFLMGYRSLTQKVKEAVFLMMNRQSIFLSVGLFSFGFIPVVYLLQVVLLVFASNLPVGMILGALLFASAWIEEVVKTIGIVALYEQGYVRNVRQVLLLALASALGFLIGEKALLLFSLSFVSESALSGAIFSSGLLLLPFLAHFFFTAFVSLLRVRTRVPYAVALLLSATLHSFYNWFILRGG